jgi:hypothetical protein
MNNQVCSCGKVDAHVFAHDVTADGERLALWTDGAITLGGVFGARLPGLGKARHRYRRHAQAGAVRMLAGSFGSMDLSEVVTAVRLGARAVMQEFSSDDGRRQWVLRQLEKAERSLTRSK